MRRKIALAFLLVMALFITACSQEKPVDVPKTPAESEISAETSEEAVAPQEIPWDLGAIYPDEAAFEAEFSLAEAKIDEISAMRGQLGTIDGIVSFFTAYDEVCHLVGRLGVYSYIQIQKDQSSNPAKELYGRVDNLYVQLAANTAFVSPQLYTNTPEFLDAVTQDPRMKPFLTQYNRDRAQYAHTLSEEEELLLQPISQLSSGADALYNTLVGSDMEFQKIKFPDGIERLADENNYSATYNKSYPQEFRVEYYNTMMQPYRQLRNTIAQNMQNYYTAITALASSRKYSSALEADLAPMDTPISVYEGVLAAANEAKPVLNKYYDLIKKSLGTTTLYRFETNATIADTPEITYPYEKTQTLIKEALAPLGEDYIAKLDEMLKSDAIDVYPAKGKSSGAFAIQVSGTHPYVLLNYTDDFQSCSTLSHELGHAVHMMYSGEQDSIYNQQATALTSEVTSTLNELLLSDYLIANAKTPEERKYYASEQLSLLSSTFFTQVFFADFQEAVANEVENKGTLTADKLDELWLNSTKECLGLDYDAIPINADGWMRIPHFYQGFYVYQYAVGMAAACDIADRIQSGEAGAVEGYRAFLKAGNSGNATEVFGLAGVDITNGDYINAFTKRFERLLAEFDEK